MVEQPVGPVTSGRRRVRRVRLPTGELRWAEEAVVPAWLRETSGERRWPVALAIVAAAGLQLALPDRLVLRPRLLLPLLELALLVGLTAANPVRMNRESSIARMASVALTALLTLATVVSVGLLVHRVFAGPETVGGAALLASGVAIWATNVIAFALWYWEFDRGGPFARAAARHPYPDFLFPQMQSPDVAPPDWEPEFPDYLYVSFTNTTAFSPTDTMPLTRWAKLVMLVQSAVSLVTVVGVVARGVNILH